MTDDEIMSVADYIHELCGQLEKAKAETESVERAYGRLTDEATWLEDERHALLEECATLEAENVRLVQRVTELEHHLWEMCKEVDRLSALL